ncbi:MAG: DEAD/DEAH box helicase [Treponemataceae bacterium]|nr:DEAD/DEAH box helicase [Treponemataceae bacterium]
MAKTFAELGVEESFISRLENIGIKIPTSVQESVIPVILRGEDTVFQSETGSGKTFAFLIPLLQRIKENPSSEVKIVILAPTFELASQLKQAASSVTDLKCALLIGGAPIKRQIETLKEKPAIVVGTPARLLELLRLKKLKVSQASALVLDEADRLFSKEISDETVAFAESFTSAVQFVACSATISAKVEKEFSAILKNVRGESAENFSTTKIKESVLRDRIEHWAFFCERREKIDFLRSLVFALKNAKNDGERICPKILVFTSRADQVENIASKLKYKGVNCALLHARTKNQERQTMLAHFKNGKTPILVTSDLSSRGLDIPDIEFVVQTDLPGDGDFFVHRAGRTARAGKRGVNIVLGDAYELRALSSLEKKLGISIQPKELRGGKITAIGQEARGEDADFSEKNQRKMARAKSRAENVKA